MRGKMTAGYRKHLVGKPYKRRKQYRLPRNTRTGGYIGKELKFYDDELTTRAVVATVAGSEQDPPTTLCCNSPVQGDGESERIGRMCYFTSLELRGWVLFSAAAGVAAPLVPGYVRILVVKDRQSNGAQFNAEDVLLAPDGNNSTEAMRNLEFLQRFVILKDIIVHQTIYGGVGTAADADYNAQQVPWRCNVKLNMKTLYTGTTGTISNVIDNSIHIMAMYQGSTTPTMGYVSRVRFYT